MIPRGVSDADPARGVRARPPSCGPVRVVAVDGPSGAGKTTYAARLARALGGCPVVRSDDFPVPWDDPLAWWWPFAEHVLAPLAAGRPGRYRRYDWRRGAYAETVVVAPGPALVVEGVGAAWKGAVDRLAYAVWVEAPHPLRLERVLRRDGAAILGAWVRWTAVEDAHFAADGTRDRADLIVDTSPRAPRDTGGVAVAGVAGEAVGRC